MSTDSELPATRRLATIIGGFSAFIGVLLFATPIAVLLRADTEQLATLDAALPTGWEALAFFGGLAIGILGATIGIRYGHLERYHKDYDPETGRIESSHPFAAFAERVAKDETYGDAVAGQLDKRQSLSFRGYLVFMLVVFAPLPAFITWQGVNGMGEFFGSIFIGLTFGFYLVMAVGGAALATYIGDQMEL